LAKDQKDHRKSSEKLIHKYILEIRDEDTFEKKLSLRLSRLNVLTLVGTVTIFLVCMIILLIVYTPLREYLLGYKYVSLSREIVLANFKADSIDRELNRKVQYIENLKKILDGDIGEAKSVYGGNSEVNTTQLAMAAANAEKYKNIDYKRSPEDSMLRKRIESEDRFNLTFDSRSSSGNSAEDISKILFFTPVKGILTDTFNLGKEHYGVDIVAPENEPVKATLDGTVTWATWTSATGHVISIQHQHNLMSIYKHNSVLLKKVGDKVKSGEVVAVVGNSGDLTTGTHLHFELWFEGNPVNPEHYMIF